MVTYSFSASTSDERMKTHVTKRLLSERIMFTIFYYHANIERELFFNTVRRYCDCGDVITSRRQMTFKIAFRHSTFILQTSRRPPKETYEIFDNSDDKIRNTVIIFFCLMVQSLACVQLCYSVLLLQRFCLSVCPSAAHARHSYS